MVLGGLSIVAIGPLAIVIPAKYIKFGTYLFLNTSQVFLFSKYQSWQEIKGLTQQVLRRDSGS